MVEPQLEADGHRLFIYLQTDKTIFVCLAQNKERDDILKEVQHLLIQGMGHTTHVYAERVENQAIEEIMAGVDYEIYAVGIFVPAANKHRVVVTGYGDSFMGAMRSVSWMDFLQRLLGKGVDAL